MKYIGWNKTNIELADTLWELLDWAIRKCSRTAQRQWMLLKNNSWSKFKCPGLPANNLSRHINEISALYVFLFPPLPSSSLCKGRTLYSVVRDAKVALDVNKTRQIAQEMVKVKPLTADSRQHFILQEGQKHTGKNKHVSPYVCVCILRGWATSTPRGFYTKTWSPRMCFTTTAKLSSPTLDSSPYRGFYRLAGIYGRK